jgi:hypothetical protein
VYASSISARGGLIDEAALKVALDSGSCCGCGARRVRGRTGQIQRVVRQRSRGWRRRISGASTSEAQENVALQVAEQISDYLQTGAITNALNMPSINAQEAQKVRPWIALAEKLGLFAGQVTDSQHPNPSKSSMRASPPISTSAPSRRLQSRPAQARALRRQHGQRTNRRQGTLASR